MKNLFVRKVGRSVFMTTMAALLLAGCGQEAPVATEPEEPITQTVEDVEAVEEEQEDLLLTVIKMVLEPDTEIDWGGKTLRYDYVPEGDGCEEGHGKFTYDGQVFETEESMEYPCNSYVVGTEDGNFRIFYEMAFSNDWAETQCIVHYGNGQFESNGRMPEGIDSLDDINVEENTVTLHSRIDLFGTYGYSKTYIMGDQGLELLGDMVFFENEMRYPDGDYFEDMDISADDEFCSVFDEYGRRILTTKRSLSLKSDDGEALDVPAGTKFLVVGYAPEEYKFYVELEGKQLYFNYEEKPDDMWGHNVDGIDENEIFEYLLFVG